MMAGIGVGQEQPGGLGSPAPDPESVQLASPPRSEGTGRDQLQAGLVLRPAGDQCGGGVRGAIVDHPDERPGRLGEQGLHTRGDVLFFIPDGQQDRDVAANGRGRRQARSPPPPLSGPQRQAEETTAEHEGSGERDVHGSAGGGSLFEGRLDLAWIGETPCLFLGEEQLVVDGDLEDPTRSLDELRFDAELLLDLLRQTGGAGVVVSDPAVLDDDACGHARLLSARIIASVLFKIGIKWREWLLLNYKVRLGGPTGQSRTWTGTGFSAGTVSIIEIVQSPPTVEVACHGQDCR
jgi:hypothetical protein